MLRETWGNVTFIPDTPLVYSEDLDRGHVFISQCAASAQDMREKGGYLVERYLLSSDAADITYLFHKNRNTPVKCKTVSLCVHTLKDIQRLTYSGSL